MEKLKIKIPLKRFGEPEEIADIVYFFGSDQNSYITGQNILCDGGFFNNMKLKIKSSKGFYELEILNNMNTNILNYLSKNNCLVLVDQNVLKKIKKLSLS